MITSIHENPNTLGTVDPMIDVPVNEWWGIRFGEGDRNSWQAASERLVDRGLRTFMEHGARAFGPWGAAAVREYFGNDDEMTPEAATTAYGIPNVLQFDAPIRESDARARQAKTKAEMSQAEWAARAKHGALSWKGISGFGAMVAGQMSNPLDFGLSIMPIFGAEKIGAEAAATVGWRQALKFGADLPLTAIGQRGGLFSFKAAGIAAKYPLFTESVLNGAASSAVGELATFFDQKALQEETNYFGNVVVGAVSSGAFHAGIRLLGRIVEPAARALRSLTPETLEVAGHLAPQMDRITPQDGPLQRAAAGADENVINESSGQVILYHSSDVEFTGFKEGAQKSGYYPGFYTSVEPDMAAQHGAKHFAFDASELSIFKLENADALKKEARAAGFETTEGSGKGEVEYLKSQGFDGMQRGKEVVVFETSKLKQTDSSVFNQKISNTRETRVKAFIDSQDPKVKAEQVKAETQRNLAEAEKRTAPTPKGDKWSKAIGDLEKEKAQLDAESAELEMQLRKELAEIQGDTKRVSELDVELKKLKDNADLTMKAEKAAIDCLLKGPNA